MPTKAQGWSENGGVAVVVPGTQGSGAQRFQGSFRGATVTVYDSGTLNLATIYADNAGTAKANPFTADIATGYWFFYGDGAYDIQFSGGGISSPITLGDFLVGWTTVDAAEFPGATADAKIRNAIASLPSTGGVIDARRLHGAQTFVADPFSGVSTKPVTLLLGAATFTASVNVTVPAGLSIDFAQGAIISMNSGRVLTYSGSLVGSISQHFAGAGTVSMLSPHIDEAFTEWWGALGDGSTDDTLPIQAAIDACRGPLSGARYTAACPVTLLSKTYKTTAQLNIYHPAGTGVGTYVGFWFRGVSKFASCISYQGPANQSVIKMIGHFQKLSTFRITNAIATGWLDAIQYDGDSGIGISTGGWISNVWIEGDSKPGNGITTGRSRFQADQLEIDHCYIAGLTSGYAVQTQDSNALSINLISPNINHCWIGVGVYTSSNMTVLGGEFDNNDVNFQPLGGCVLTVTGIRTEGSKKMLASTNGSYPHPLTFVGVQAASDYASENSPPRQAATCTSTGATTITLSNDSVTFGDWIVIAGAGVAGADLHTRIASMTDPLHATIDTTSISTPVTNAVVTLDAAVEQNYLYEGGAGPYVHINCFFNLVSAVFLATQGPQVFTGCSWAQNIPNPFNITDTTALPAKATWTGCYNYFSGITMMPSWVPQGNNTGGRYSPTATIVTNLDSCFVYDTAQYIRNNNSVVVSGLGGYNATAPGAIVFRVSLPIASNLAASVQLFGVGVDSSGNQFYIQGIAATNDAQFTLTATGTGDVNFTFTFSYEVFP